MSLEFAQALILIPSSLCAGLLLFISSVVQKLFDDFEVPEFKWFLTKLVYHAEHSPYAIIVSVLTVAAAIPYWLFYHLDSLWFSAGLALWIIAQSASKLLNLPIYNRVIKDIPETDIEQLRAQRKKLHFANFTRAYATLLSVILMAIAFA